MQSLRRPLDRAYLELPGVEFAFAGCEALPAPAGLFETVPAPVASVRTLVVAPGPELTAAGEPGLTTLGVVAFGAVEDGMLVWAKAGPASSKAAAAITNFIVFSRLRAEHRFSASFGRATDEGSFPFRPVFLV